MKQAKTTKQPLEELPHVSTYGRYDEIRGILDRKRRGIDCNEDESRAIKVWVKYETLAIGNGSIELDTEIQELLPLEWGEAQDEIGNCDENGKLKEMGLIKLYSPAPDSKEGLHTQGEWKYDGHGVIYVHSPREPIVEVRNYSNVSEQQANAELIVRAVNERKALLDSHRELQKSFDEAIQRLTDLYMETTDLERDKKEMERPFIIATKEFIISANKKQ